MKTRIFSRSKGILAWLIRQRRLVYMLRFVCYEYNL